MCVFLFFMNGRPPPFGRTLKKLLDGKTVRFCGKVFIRATYQSRKKLLADETRSVSSVRCFSSRLISRAEKLREVKMVHFYDAVFIGSPLWGLLKN
jgi:hypothetical protein